MIRIYHNPRCKTSRAGLSYLKSKTNDFEVVRYLDDPLSYPRWEKLIRKTNKKPNEMLRRQEDYYKKKLKGKTLTDKEIIEEMVSNPKLIQRPVVENDKLAVLAQPLEEIDKII